IFRRDRVPPHISSGDIAFSPLKSQIEWVSMRHQPPRENFVTTQEAQRMTTFSELPAMARNAVQQAQEDMALIARGEEIDLPWRRLRVLLDHGLVEITTPVLLGGPLAGSRTSISWTDEGTRFMGQAS
ncbi:hypothetical protein, partial [Sinorhizobium meliloti]|uniref:hypothetical protein n=2 Tax=Sinorhizobium/Ensifer group TaxID=227292 RepID=UPI001F2CA428